MNHNVKNLYGNLVFAVHFLALFRSDLQWENGWQSPGPMCTFDILVLHTFMICTQFLLGTFVLSYFSLPVECWCNLLYRNTTFRSRVVWLRGSVQTRPVLAHFKLKNQSRLNFALLAITHVQDWPLGQEQSFIDFLLGAPYH